MQKSLFNLPTALISRRTVIRRFRENEGKQLYDLVQENKGLIEADFPRTLAGNASPESAESYVRLSISDWLLQKNYLFGIWETGSEELIGIIRLFELEWDIPKAEIAYFIDHKVYNQGLMSEVMQAILPFCFEELHLNRLFARTATDNYNSQRLLRKSGFLREGDARRAFRRQTTGELIDIMLFGMTKEEYRP